MSSQDILNEITAKISTDKEAIRAMSQSDLLAYIQSSQKALSKKHKVVGEVRLINIDAYEEIASKANSEKGTKLVFRHGEQDFNGDASLSAAEKKIVMMQSPHNETDPITSLSAIEFFSTAALLVKMNLNITVHTSSNLRAQQPAAVLGEVLKTPVVAMNELNCMNYPSEPEFSERQLQNSLDKGALPWVQQNIDAVGGPETYAKFTAFAQKFVANPIESDVLVVITHTQQTNAICEASKLLTPRFASYGFAFISPQGSHKIYENGFYSSQKFNLNDDLVSNNAKQVTYAYTQHKAVQSSKEADTTAIPPAPAPRLGMSSQSIN